jgi:hypothetical protein
LPPPQVDKVKEELQKEKPDFKEIEDILKGFRPEKGEEDEEDDEEDEYIEFGDIKFEDDEEQDIEYGELEII